MKAIIIALRNHFPPDRYMTFTELYQRKHGSVPHSVTVCVEASSQTGQSFAASVLHLTQHARVKAGQRSGDKYPERKRQMTAGSPVRTSICRQATMCIHAGTAESVHSLHFV